MFYPVESLRKGGRFYLCWVADSWPMRFATITHRQLWSHDIRKICDDLLEVVMNESGRPAKRFSLRLSSQLLRGLVRLYERKVSIFLGDMCMIHANVFKNTNKKYQVLEVDDIAEQIRRPQLQVLEVQPILHEQPENEPRVEEMIQASGNIVANVEDITLKEATIAEVPLPYDGFGEENPEQALQLLHDRTLEMMLVQPDVTSHSVIELALDTTDKSYDKSKDKSRTALDPQMETISEMDVTLFRKSAINELNPEFEKDIPEIPNLEISAPEVTKVQDQLVSESAKVEEPPQPLIPAHRTKKPIEIELEELEEPQAKRRKTKKLFDKKIKIGTNYFRSRIENPMVELRCMDSTEDIIFIHVPAETYFKRPCHGGSKIHSNVGFDIMRLFLRNLGVVAGQTYEERELEEAVIQRSTHTIGRSILEKIHEEPESIQEIPQIQVERPTSDTNITHELNVVMDQPRVSVEPVDIAEMLTQKVETLSQARKRTTEDETVQEPKRRRSMGYISFRESQKSKEKNASILDSEADKENIPQNIQQQVVEPESVPTEASQPAKDLELILSSMLQEVGLADMQNQPATESHTQRQTSRKTGSERSETPLGSLDRTKVSLGDSDQTTDSKRFIRDQWGAEGTMMKIIRMMKAGLPVTVRSLIIKGPVIPGYQRIIAARCFSSILKLKQHGFINICKDPDTQEIRDVTLGPKFGNMNE